MLKYIIQYVLLREGKSKEYINTLFRMINDIFSHTKRRIPVKHVRIIFVLHISNNIHLYSTSIVIIDNMIYHVPLMVVIPFESSPHFTLTVCKFSILMFC